MANHWLRLWHDMPNDPKWRTVARIAEQPISLVLSVYVHLLVEASRNVTRGHAAVTPEDLASALDVTEDSIKAVLAAMQSRLLEGMYLLGWEKRQPKREDVGDEERGAKSAAQRKADQRAREKAAEKLLLDALAVTQSHDVSRNVTTDKDKEEDKENSMSDASASNHGDFVEKRKKSREPTNDDFDAARWVADLQSKAVPDSRQPNLKKWANDIRLMREIDNRTHRQICEMFKWAKADKFWAPNIQSPQKLREKWDQLAERRAVETPPEPVREKLKWD